MSHREIVAVLAGIMFFEPSPVKRCLDLHLYGRTGVIGRGCRRGK